MLIERDWHTNEPWIEGASDLVIELERDKIDKLKTYAAYLIPEYWIIDPSSYVLEQYFITNDRYKMIKVFQAKETITSQNITCVSFTMQDIKDHFPSLYNKS